MAAAKPIVSTPVTDVQEPYGDIVYIAHGAEAFVQACERALQAPPAERQRRQEQADRVLAETSWDDTAHRMMALLDAAVRERRMRTTSGGVR